MDKSKLRYRNDFQKDAFAREVVAAIFEDLRSSVSSEFMHVRIGKDVYEAVVINLLR